MKKGRVCRLDLEMAVARLETEITGLRDLMVERDRRYTERDAASKEAEALQAASLHEYKVSSNEWREALNGVIARNPTRDELERRTKVLEDKIADLRETRSLGVGRDEVLEQSRKNARWLIGLSVATIVDMVALVAHFLIK